MRSMSTLTEIEAAAERLPAVQQRELIRFLTARIPRGQGPEQQPYTTRTHPGDVLAGIDADKLGQIPEEF